MEIINTNMQLMAMLYLVSWINYTSNYRIVFKNKDVNFLYAYPQLQFYWLMFESLILGPSSFLVSNTT